MSAMRRDLLKLPLKVISRSDSAPDAAVDPVPTPSQSGDAYWRSLEQLAGSDEYKTFFHREFQEGASELTDPMSRRTFLTLMGASISLAALTGCRKPVEKIVPYVRTPEETILGRPEQYTTAAVIAGTPTGLLITSRDGRPIKIDGNELHPASRGGSSVYAQAEILNLYDPDRLRSVRNRGVASDWESFADFWRSLRNQYVASGGAGLAVISEEIHSPTLSKLRRQFLAQFPNARWAIHQPVSDREIYDGAKLAFGAPFRPHYDYSKARVILALDSDFLMTETNAVASARQFAEGRRLTDGSREMNRLYAVEANFSVTGAMADHRLRMRGSDVERFAFAVAAELVKLGVPIPGLGAAPSAEGLDLRWIAATARDLASLRGEALVVAGRSQSYRVQALICAINEGLGSAGRAVSYSPVEDGSVSSREEWAGFVADLKANRSISTLVVLGGDPAATASGFPGFAEAVKSIPHIVSLAHLEDAAAKLAEWCLPQAHFLEAWGDLRSTDGSLSVQQPTLEPLFGGRSEVELVSFLTTGVLTPGFELVRETWGQFLPPSNFEKDWRRVLHDGKFASPENSLSTPPIRRDLTPLTLETAVDRGVEIGFKPSPSLWDGRYANNGWLQELPDPITKLTWDNAALISPSTAERLGVKPEDLISISLDGRAIEIAAFVLPGHADDSITLPLGYGRNGIGRVAEGAGVDVYPLRSADGLWFAAGATVRKSGGKYSLASSQNHHSMEGRPIVREGTLEEYRRDPHFAPEMVHEGAAPSLWKEQTYNEGYQWGMTIDLNSCIGCNACAVACQSENNIPIVGKRQILRGREMHWIRLDRYFTGDQNNPQAVTQPVGCQQCELAPCEQVCPVAATSHDAEGLNVMTYNRCVGTRYCSNNCPYKVRRFNFFNFTNDLDALTQMAQNPEVTVRSRGVMEKCTYCVQRINRGKHNAKMENRDVRDGEVVSACQAACPTQAIVFGNINDPESRVSKLKKEERRYDLLAELNTRPRTSYLAKVRNPNPELND